MLLPLLWILYVIAILPLQGYTQNPVDTYYL